MKAVLTDIEGTTTSIAFVTDVLFPYARARLPGFVEAHRDDLIELLEAVPGEPVATLLAWDAQDAKATPLKTIQGMIWAHGYADGSLVGHVYPDAAAALVRWHAAGLVLGVFSSGSIAAQKLIFGHSDHGDLSGLFTHHFDTTSGPKREAASYRSIAEAMALAPADILFLSDTPAEVAAARAAGMQALRVDRDGGRGDIASFAEVQA